MILTATNYRMLVKEGVKIVHVVNNSFGHGKGPFGVIEGNVEVEEVKSLFWKVRCNICNGMLLLS